MPRPGESLRPELREFLDAVVVPALLEKYLAENSSESASEISVEAGESAVPYSDLVARRGRREV
jgi:hypothetical protein